MNKRELIKQLYLEIENENRYITNWENSTNIYAKEQLISHKSRKAIYEKILDWIEK